MTRARFFHDLRISRSFVMTDFLQSPSLYNARLRLTPADLRGKFGGGAIVLGNMLEQLIDLFGPVSVAAGYVPPQALGRGHPPDSPHGWTDRKAAADIVFHDWVNKGKAPITILNALPKHAPFHRVISYAGSEFLCVTAEHTSAHRHAVIEGHRKPTGGSTRIRWCDGHSAYQRLHGAFPERPDWRRHDHEVPGNSPELRAHHVRVGEYFTLLDFCRSPYAYESGRPWVIPPGHEPQTTYARMAAEVLGPVVKGLGRVSIIRGLMPKALAEQEDDHRLWTWREGAAAVEFLTNGDVAPNQVMECLTHKSIEQVTAYELEAGVSYRVEWQPFKHRKTWSSAVQPVSQTRKRSLDIS